jgi:hypothetical protein
MERSLGLISALQRKQKNLKHGLFTASSICALDNAPRESLTEGSE